MPVLNVGNTSIPYEIKRSPRARRIRITVRPGQVSVTAPRFALRRSVVAFVESRAQWIHDKRTALRERELPTIPQRFIGGERVWFRGRSFELRVESGSEDSVRFAGAFIVTLAPGLQPGQQEERTRDLVMGWLQQRALADAQKWSSKYGALLGVHPKRLRLGNQKTLWGSCSARGVIALNWRLIATPKPVFEYVVVHELCHLVEHNHGPKFWELVETLLPEYRDRRAWLKHRGVGLG